MVVCGSYMYEFSVSKDMKKKEVLREVAVGKVVAHLCLILIVKELKISVEHGMVVTTLNMIFCVVTSSGQIGACYKLSTFCVAHAVPCL